MKIKNKLESILESPSPVEFNSDVMAQRLKDAIVIKHIMGEHKKIDTQRHLVSDGGEHHIYHYDDGIHTASRFVENTNPEYKGHHLVHVATHKMGGSGDDVVSNIVAASKHFNMPVLSDNRQSKGGVGLWKKLHALHPNKVTVFDMKTKLSHPVTNVMDHFGEDKNHMVFSYDHRS